MKKTLIYLFIGAASVANTLMAQNHIIVNNTTSATINASGISSDHISNSTAYKNNFSLGEDALKNNLNGMYNTAVGIQSLQNLNGLITTMNGIPYRFGNSNTALGFQTLMSNVNGGSNVAIGASALRIHDGGAIGTSSYRTNTGYGNVAIGTSSMGNSTGGLGNVALGLSALYNTVGKGNPTWLNNFIEYQGSENVALGMQSMLNNTIGKYNVAVGSSSIKNNTTTSNNTAIGHEALFSLVDAGNALPPFPPYSAYPAGNVAVGFQAGYSELGSNKLYIENSNSSAPLIGGDFSTDKVGINRLITDLALRTENFQVTGNAYISGNLVVNATTYPSDIRYKKNIRILEDPLPLLNKLAGVRYDFDRERFPEMSANPQIGLIAQEVEKVFPELVNTDPNGFKSVNYALLTPILLEAINNLSQKIEALEKSLNK